MRQERGQGTVEFALLAAAFSAIVLALGLLWHELDGGAFVDHSCLSASHVVEAASAGAIGDVLAY